MSTQLSAPLIDWTSLGQVAGVSFVFGIAIVTLFSIGIVGLSWMRGAEDHPDHDAVSGASGLAAIDSGAQAAHFEGSRPVGTAVAATCFALCGAAVIYGLYLIIPQFHK